MAGSRFSGNRSNRSGRSEAKGGEGKNSAIGKILGEIERELNENGLLMQGVLNEHLVRKTEELALQVKETQITNSSIRKIYESFVNCRIRMHHEFIKVFNERRKKESEKCLKEDSIESAEEENLIKTAEEEAFRKVKPYVMLLKSNSRYVLEKKREGTKKSDGIEGYQAIEDFIVIFTPHINSKPEFEGFMDLFECILGNLKG